MTTLPDDETLLKAEALLAQIPLDRIPEHQRPCVEWLIDDQFPISSFVGRVDLLKQLAAAMASTTPTMIVPTLAVTGMGGIGKTSLALEFAYRYGNYFAGGVYWINAANSSISTTILPAVDRLWQKLFPNRDSSQIAPEQRINDIKSFFNSPIPRLLIFDNCEQQWIFETYQPGPQSGCRVLMTSRNAVWSTSNVQSIAIDLLTPAESRQMLQKLSPRITDAEADDLANLVGYLPLALHVMGVALGTLEPSLPVENYYQRVQRALLAQLEATANNLQNIHRSPTNHQWSVVATVHVSYDLLKSPYRDEGQLRNLLLLLACCAPNAPIPIDLLIRATEHDSATVGAWLYALRQSGFFDHDPPQLHPLMREAIQIIEAEHYPNAANTMIAALVAEGTHAHENWDREAMLALVPHLETCHEVEKTKQGYTGHLLFILASITERQGDYCQAERLIRELLEYEIALYGNEHQEVLTTQHNLAWVIHAQGNYNEALTLYQSILEVRQQILGDEHPHTLTTQHQLANVLYSQGAYAKATDRYQSVLRIRQQMLGDEHPDTLLTLHNLARVLYIQGYQAEALNLYEAVLEIRQRVLGMQHPHTLITKHQLAGALYDQGNFTKAFYMYQSILAIQKQILGMNHPHTLITHHNLANVLKAQKSYVEAFDIYQSVFTIRQKVLGTEHPDTLITQSSIATCLAYQGQYYEAITLLDEIIPKQIRSYGGAGHPNVQTNIKSRDAILADFWQKRQ